MDPYICIHTKGILEGVNDLIKIVLLVNFLFIYNLFLN